jgi:hypothetical protein
MTPENAAGQAAQPAGLTPENAKRAIPPLRSDNPALGYLLNRSRSAVDTTESAGQVGIRPSQADSGGTTLTCAAPVT